MKNKRVSNAVALVRSMWNTAIATASSSSIKLINLVLNNSTITLLYCIESFLLIVAVIEAIKMIFVPGHIHITGFIIIVLVLLIVALIQWVVKLNSQGNDGKVGG